MTTQSVEHSFNQQTVPPVLSINEVIDLSKTSRYSVYLAISQGHLKTYKRGRRRFATGPDFIAWITRGY